LRFQEVAKIAKQGYQANGIERIIRNGYKKNCIHKILRISFQFPVFNFQLKKNFVSIKNVRTFASAFEKKSTS